MAASSYDLPGIPWVSYILDNGISFHGTYWHNQYGQPRSHGCINLTPQDALWIYRWTSPAVPLEKATIEEKTGTMVNIIENETE
jgi:lipoprotein-anchoring transpeptidase ErfK/SrfK